MRRALIALCLGLAAGCATINPGASEVAIMKGDPAAGCEELGTVRANEWDLESAKNSLRNKAHALGANYVRWDTTDGEGRMTGTAFRCPVSATAAQQF